MNVFYKSFIFSLIFSVFVIFTNTLFIPVVGVYYDQANAQPLSQFINNQNNVHVPAGSIAYIDQNININQLHINGQLHCDPSQTPNNTIVRATTIEVHGILQCGKSNQRYNKNITFSLKSDPNNPNPRDFETGFIQPYYRGLLVHPNGKLIIHGNKSKSGYVKLNETLQIGDDYIVVDRGQSIQSLQAKQTLQNTWSVGDKIVIGTTSFNPNDAEEFYIREIDSLNPNKYYLARDEQLQQIGIIQKYHHGQTQTLQSQSMGNVRWDERAEVANLSRNIKIIGDEQDFNIPETQYGTLSEIGGHIMIHKNGYGYVDSVELYKMGQAGALARYPIHWHLARNVHGQYIQNSSIHKSFQRCITIHGTNHLKAQNNTCYDFKGHGIFLEDGSERKNIITNNLALLSKVPFQNRALRPSDIKGIGTQGGRFHATSCYWISNPDNYITHNIASGCHQTGFWMSFTKETVSDGSKPNEENTLAFNYNIAHSNKVGMTWDGEEFIDRVRNVHYSPPVAPIMIGLKAYKNSLTGIYFRSDTTVLKDSITADNGWSFWNAYNQIIQDSIIVGKTQNTHPQYQDYLYSMQHRRRKAGVIMYDGPFEVHNTDFLNFSTLPEYRVINGVERNISHIPFVAIAGARKLTNFTSGLRFQPEPYYRMHLHDEDNTLYQYQLQRLSQNSIKDLDGTLSGVNGGAYISANRSLAILPESNCIDGENTLKNFKVCPNNFTEGVLFNRLFQSLGVLNPNGNPFVVMRDDFAFSYPIDLWDEISSLKNLNISYPEENQLRHYQILEKDEFYRHQNPITKDPASHIVFEANSYRYSHKPSTFELVHYGENCRLEKEKQNQNTSPIQVNNYNELLSENRTAYYNDNQTGNLVFKLVSKDQFRRILPTPFSRGNAFETYDRFKVTCDNNNPLPNKIIGRIDNVRVVGSNLRINGWACETRKDMSIDVDLFVRDNSAPINNQFILINTQTSNFQSEARVAFKCGMMSENGKRFDINIPMSQLSQYIGQEIHVIGRSNFNNSDQFLNRSGYFTVPNPIAVSKKPKKLRRK